MPGLRTTPSSSAVSDLQGDAQGEIICPFRGYDGCNKKKSYSRTGLITHLGNLHLDKVGKDLCCERINTDAEVLCKWEEALSQLRMWLCAKCMNLHAWSRSCRLHQGEVMKALDNGDGADFLIHGICVAETVAYNDGVGPSDCVLPVLSLELLDSVFKRQIRTVSSVPVK